MSLHTAHIYLERAIMIEWLKQERINYPFQSGYSGRYREDVDMMKKDMSMSINGDKIHLMITIDIDYEQKIPVL